MKNSNGTPPGRGGRTTLATAAGAALCLGVVLLLALLPVSCGGGGGTAAEGEISGPLPDGIPENRPARQTLLLTVIGDRVIVPAYESMARSLASLEGSTLDFCAAPTKAGLATVREAWADAMQAWLQAGTVQFGPIRDDNRRLRIHFWPDDNNNVRRAVQQLVARDDALDVEVLSRQSVAGQGLPALEQLLFAPDVDVLASFTDDPRAARRCTYAVAIAGNLRGIADELVHEWQRSQGDYVDQLVRAGNGSDVFADRSMAIEEVVNSLVTVVEVTKNNRIGDPLGGESVAEAKPFRAESYLSGHSLDNVVAAVRGLHEVYTGDGEHFGFDDYLRGLEELRLNVEILNEFETVLELADAIPVPLAEAVQREDQREQVVALFDAATRLTRLLKNQLSAAMQVTVGFNENDGD